MNSKGYMGVMTPDNSLSGVNRTGIYIFEHVNTHDKRIRLHTIQDVPEFAIGRMHWRCC